MSLHNDSGAQGPRVRSPGDCVLCNKPPETRRGYPDTTLPSGHVVKLCGTCLRPDAMLERRLEHAKQRAVEAEAQRC